MKNARKKRILIVDDEEGWISVLDQFLKNHFNHELFEVSSATDPIEALKIIDQAEGEFDLVSTCLVMPYMNGFDFIAEVHRNYPHIKIMVITALHGRDESKRAMDMGADIFLCKPIDMKIYKEIISDQLTIRPLEPEKKALAREQVRVQGRIKYLCQPQGGKDHYELVLSVPDLDSTTLLDEGLDLLGSEEGDFLLIYKGKYRDVIKRYHELREKGW
jgi:DNA-binding NtrC family response regulator